MVELVALVGFMVVVAAVILGWRVLARSDVELDGDARSVITAGQDGSMVIVVANPGSEAVVVTACARPANRFRLFGRDQVRRARSQQERRTSSRAARQLLGSVGPGGEATWTVVGDAATRPVCRVVLSIYHAGQRVRVHEQVVRTGPGLVEVGLAGRRSFARRQLPAGS